MEIGAGAPYGETPIRGTCVGSGEVTPSDNAFAIGLARLIAIEMRTGPFVDAVFGHCSSKRELERIRAFLGGRGMARACTMQAESAVTLAVSYNCFTSRSRLAARR